MQLFTSFLHSIRQQVSFYANGLSWIIFLGLLSQVNIPLWPVPVTGQILGFFLLGLWHSPKRTFIISFSYIVLGIVGFPLFHGLLGGFKALVSPTFGYILGFPFISVIVSLTKRHFSSFNRFFFFHLLAIVPCYLLGIFYLSFFLGFSKALLFSGFLIFIPAEILKILFSYSAFVYKNKPRS
jgi:biotin transport system substrate-specific component